MVIRADPRGFLASPCDLGACFARRLEKFSKFWDSPLTPICCV